MSDVVITGGGPPNPEFVKTVLREESLRATYRALAAVDAVWKKVAEPHRRTGTYMRSLAIRVEWKGTYVLGEIGTKLHYAPYLEYGTGIYGPRHRMIVPVKGTVMVFPAGGSAFTLAGRQRSGAAGASAGFVFTTKVKGIKPQRLGQTAARESVPAAILQFREGGRRIAERLRLK